jgi:hypothetical protein
MKKTPSFGFIYLVSVLIGLVIFISWVAQKGWYERIHTLRQTKTDLVRGADYKKNIDYGYTDPKSFETLVERNQLWRWVDHSTKVLRILEKGLKVKLFPLYRGKIKDIDHAKENFEAGQRDWDTISVLLESIADQPDAALAINIVQAILEADLSKKQILGNGQIVALGLTPDRWTYDGKPGFIVVSESKVRLKISCYARHLYMPLTVTIEDQYGEKSILHVFKYSGDFELELPSIPVGENRLFVIKTDKFWIPPKSNNRRLGVRVTPLN